MKFLMEASSHESTIIELTFPNFSNFFSLPNNKLSLIEKLNRTGSCCTYPIKSLK